ncbi:MAG: BrnA antitoxin family protein [Gammaproteobacteria bacterium]
MKSASSRSAKQPAAKRSSSSVKSRTDWTKLKAGTRVTATSDHPEADVRHIMRGIVRRGLKPQLPKTAVSLRIERDVLEWFKAQGSGYQTRMNAVLRAYRDASL